MYCYDTKNYSQIIFSNYDEKYNKNYIDIKQDFETFFVL